MTQRCSLCHRILDNEDLAELREREGYTGCCNEPAEIVAD